MNPIDTLNWIDEHLVIPSPSENLSGGEEPLFNKPDPIPCSLPELLDFCKPENGIFWTPQLELGLLTGCAASVSLRFKGLPLWIFHVGPPGSGKSLLNAAIGGHRMSVELSKATGLVSGSRDSEGDIIESINNHVFCCKDFTTMLEMPQAQLARFFGEARDAYDGFTSSAFLNGEKKSFNKIHYSCVFGVTHEIMARDFTALGERYLKVDISSPEDGGDEDCRLNIDEEDAQFHSAFDPESLEEDEEGFDFKIATRQAAEQLRALTAGFVDSLWQRPVESIYVNKSEEVKNAIMNAARFLSQARTQSKVDRIGDLLYRPVAETPRRTCRQLLKFANCLAVVQSKKEVDKVVLSQVVRVALDSTYGFSRDIILRLFQHAEHGLTTDELCGETQIPKSTLDKRLKHLSSIGLIAKEKARPPAGSQGRYRNCWFLSDHMVFWLKYLEERTTPETFALHPVQNHRWEF